MHGSFKIPLANIKKAWMKTSASGQSFAGEIKMPGTCIPGITKTGTYHTRKRKDFWYATRKTPHRVLELDEGRQQYRRIALSVDEADGLKNTINSAIL